MADISKIVIPNGTECELNDNRIKIYRDVAGTAAVTTSPYYAARYDVTDENINAYKDGMMVSLKVPVAGHGTYGTCFQINNLGYKPIVCNINTMISNRYGVNSQIICVYNSEQTATAYLGGGSQTITGCWQVCDYDANSTTTYGTINYYFRPYVGANALYRYKLCALDKDNRIVPMTITEQTSTTQVAKVPNSVAFRPDNIWLYNTTTTINAGALINAQTLLDIGYLANGCQYNFNESIPAYKMIYLRGTYDSTTGLYTLYKDTSSPCTSYYTVVPDNEANIDLSDYFVSGYYYILVGATYSSANYLQLFGNNELYYFDGTNLVKFTDMAGTSANASKVNGHTVNTDVPADAKFTDTTYSDATTSAHGLMTAADKTKLNGIATGAEVNVQSDWNVTDTASDAFIKNKPTIPAAVTESTVSGWGFTKNAGTVTGIKMNGASKGTSGVVDLGTVITAHQSLSAYRTSSAQDAIDNAITAKMSSLASSTNKLVSASEMGDAIEAVEAKQIYKDASQGSFATKAQLTSATTFYNADGTVATPTKNDVAYVLADESHDGKSAKYVIASISGSAITWGFVITFSDVSFTQAQMNAINSGITSADKTKLNGIAEGATANIGTITGITMNGASKGTSGVVNLGTVITDVSGKLDVAQGASHAGEFLVVGSDGNITTKTMSAWQGGSY